MANGLLFPAITQHLNSEMSQVIIDAVGRDEEVVSFFPSRLVSPKPNIEWRVNSEGNSSFGPYVAGDPEPAAGAQTYLEAELDYKRIAGTVKIDRQIIATTNDFAVIEDFLTTEMAGAALDFVQSMADGLLSDGSAGQINGMADIADTVGTYAGISRATFPFWASIVTIAAGGTLTLDDMKATTRQLRDDPRKRRPTVLVCDPTTWVIAGDLIEADSGKRVVIEQTQIRDTGTGLSFESGYRAIRFEGALIVEVTGWTPNVLQFLHLPNFEIQIVREFEMDEPERIADNWE